MSSTNKKNKARNSYVHRNKSLVETDTLKRLYFFNSVKRRKLKETLRHDIHDIDEN